MRLLVYFLSAIVCLGVSWGYDGDHDNDDNRLELLSNQVDLLKSANENLKLRLKIMEQNHNVVLEFLNKKEGSKICVKTNDDKRMCAEELHYSSCEDSENCSNNKCRIQNSVYGPEPFLVACDVMTDGGGWTVIQRRLNGSVDFYRGWSEYKTGFGNLDGEFWIGLDKLHALTQTLAPVELLIQLQDHEDVMKYAKYGKFAIGSEEELYELKEIDEYEGNAGDSFSRHKGYKFSTKDNDNDRSVEYNCAVDKKGAWWYENCNWSNLNGLYYNTSEVPKDKRGSGINWSLFHGYNYSLKYVQMMIRTKKF